jgi:hypothetical protein
MKKLAENGYVFHRLRGKPMPGKDGQPNRSIAIGGVDSRFDIGDIPEYL